MKNIIKIAAVLIATLALSCCSKEKVNVQDITGDWRLDHISTVTKGETFGIDVYLSFSDDGTFSLWVLQQAGRYKYYHGTWTNKRSIISGTYDDGSAWGAGSYKVSFKDGNLRLTAQNGSGEVTTYRKSAIPDEVKASVL